MFERKPLRQQEYSTEELLLAQIEPGDPEGWWSPAEILRLADRRGGRLVITVWLLATLVAIAAGVAVVVFEWSGLPVSLGDRAIHVTIYPPLIVGLLIFLWLGPIWAMVTTYAATFLLGAYAGLDWLPNALFALADPILILVLWSGMAILEIPPVIRRRSDWLFFLALALTGCIASSIGALVWCHAQELPFPEAMAIWEGWVVGAFAEIALIVVPIAMLLGDRPRHWLERTLRIAPRPPLGLRPATTLLVTALALFAAVSVIAARLFISSLPAPKTIEHSTALEARLPEIALLVILVFGSVLGTVALFIVVFTRRSERERHAARRDRLTGCRNRRSFDSVVRREASRSARTGAPLTLVFLDLDDFKGINDRYGHVAGDRVLLSVSRRIEREIRSMDYLFRWGGDEFVLLLPHTMRGDAESLGCRILSAVSELPIRIGGRNENVQAALSFGVATMDETDSADELVLRASADCLAAKEKRRRRG